MAFDRATVARLARCSRFAYLDPGVARGAALSDLGLHVFSECADAYAACDAETTVFAWRGTANWSDLRLDADCAVSGSPLRHDGMRRFYQSTRDWLMDAMAIPHPSKTYNTGHSLAASGGATEAAFEFPDEDLFVVTFGSPRIGLRDYVAQYIHQLVPTLRVVHDDDLVPTLPVFPFEHVCDELRINDAGEIIPEPTSWADRLYVDAKQILENLDGQALLEHPCDRYVRACDLYAKALVRP